jgi:hypothetical protein
VEVKSMKKTKKLLSFILSLFVLSMLVFSFNVSNVYAGTATSVTVDCTSNGGAVNVNSWGIGAPDKYSWWAGNSNLKARISDAKIKLVRVGPVQLGKYTGHDVYPSPNNWNWTNMDAILNTIWDAGAQPLFIVCGYPGGVAAKDWNAYATFMEGVVNRYNVQKALGASKTIKYWEMWNEPTIEGDGTLTKDEYKAFVQTVGAKMKAKDSTIKLVGPADAWSDLSGSGFVAYTASNLANYISVLSWHDYGPAPDQSDSARMAWTKPHYQDNIVTGRTAFGSFGSAITEYNMSHQDGGSTYNQKYHNEFDATYAASAIINAMKGNAELFTFYNLAETGTNLLGALSNTDYSPYKPYYTFYLFGNYTGNQKLTASGGTTNLEYYATKNTTNGKYYVTVVNKDTSGVTYDVTVNLNNISSATGSVNVRKVNSTTNPTSYTTVNYSASQFTYSVAPFNVVNFEVTPGTGGPTPTPGSTPTPPPGGTLFQTGFESADTQPTWRDIYESNSNVGAYTGAGFPECSPRLESPHTGIATLMYSGKDNSTTTSYCNFRVFDVNIAVTFSTKMSYWIYPQQDNGRYVAIDYICTDGSTLRDSGATDNNGKSMHANAGHGGTIALNAWTQIKCNVGQWLGGKTIDRILVDYDRPANSGDFRGYLDDMLITNGTLP